VRIKPSLSIRAFAVLMSLTKQLVDHTPEDLISQFARSIKHLYENMEANALEAMLSTMGVKETGDTAPYAGDFDSSMTNNAPATSSHVPLNPFMASAEVRSTGDAGGTSTNPFVISRDGKNDYTGPPMVGKRSQIGQMIDPSGKVVSQQVIVIESVLEGVEDATSGYKELQRDMREHPSLRCHQSLRFQLEPSRILGRALGNKLYNIEAT
jgi:hypothetical protein